MGLFYEMCEVFNRAPIGLSIVFDGQEISLPPLKATQVPRVAFSNGMNQNPIMGSVDPNNPHISGGQYLIGIVGDPEYPCTPLTEDEWNTHLGKPCRVNELVAFEERYGGDPKARMVVHGKGRKTTANNRSEASVGFGAGAASFTAKD